MVIWKGLAAHFGDFRQPAAIGEKDEKNRRFTHPRHFRKQVCDGINFPIVTNNENIRLLKITLRRGREGAGAQQSQQLRLYTTRAIAPMHAMRGNAGNFIETSELAVEFQPLAKAFEKRGLYDRDEIRH
jgi:hypothetical protein